MHLVVASAHFVRASVASVLESASDSLTRLHALSATSAVLYTIVFDASEAATADRNRARRCHDCMLVNIQRPAFT